LRVVTRFLFNSIRQRVSIRASAATLNAGNETAGRNRLNQSTFLRSPL